MRLLRIRLISIAALTLLLAASSPHALAAATRPVVHHAEPTRDDYSTPEWVALSRASAAYLAKDYEAAVAELMPLANMGFAPSQFLLGMMYDAGEGVPEDDAMAINLFHKAAEQGLKEAQYKLARRYYDGRGVVQDYVNAATLFKKAAEQGDAFAQGELGMMYYKGIGLPLDNNLAVYWYRKAADQGHAKGQSLLGLMYWSGNGVPQNYILAHKWLNLAAAASNGEERAINTKARTTIAELMTSAQIAEAQKLASEWTPTSSSVK